MSPSSPQSSTEVVPGSGLSFHDVLDASGDCIFVHDDTGAIAYVNATTERTYGYTLEEFRALGPDDLSLGQAPYSAAEAFTLIQEAITKGSSQFTWIARRKGGQPFWTDVMLRPVMSNGRMWVIAVVRDIEEQHHLEVARRESEIRLERVFNHSSNGLAITDLDTGRIIDVNRTWEILTGVSRERAISQTALSLGVWASETERAACRESLMNAGRVRDFEATLVTRTGEKLFQLSAESFSIGESRAVLWEFRDIDERRQLETQLAQAQKLESIGRLAGGVAHDFNNMLGVILGHVELLMLDFRHDDPRRDALMSVRHAAERSADLTHQLLAFARQQRVQPRVLDLNEAVESMLKMLRRLIGEDIALVWRPAMDTWPVKIDPVQIDQILANLCVNARDAIGGVGEVTIEVDGASISDRHGARHGVTGGEYARLSISDTGTGMAPELLTKIFEPFFTTKAKGRGTGLGLSTVHGIVAQNNGFISVTSTVGKGTRFRVHLPKCAEPLTRSAHLDQQDHTGRGEHVLVVEDEVPLLEMMRTMLELMDFVVVPCSTTDEAIRLAGDPSVRIDAMITDVIMPRMNGRQLIDGIRAVRPGMRCLFISGYTADVLAEHGVTGEGEDFLAKPFSGHALTSKLRAILDA